MSKPGGTDSPFELWRQRIERLIREHPLQIVSWEATRRCNLNCAHCGSPAEEANHDDELTTDEIVGAFEQIARDFDMSRFKHVNITGGEPFVRSDLIEVLRRISRIPHYRNTDIQTNGIVLADHPELFPDLKQYGVTGIGVSIDGLEATHDAFRRKPGSFTKAFEAARQAVRNGFTVTVGMVAHSGNVDELPQFFELIRTEVKPRIFRVLTLDAQGRTAPDCEHLLSADQFRQVISFLKSEYQRSCRTYAAPSTTVVELGCGGWMGTDLEGTFRPMIFHCIAGINNLGILYDGKLASCSNISREFIEGDLRTESIEFVWQNRYQRYRDLEWKHTGQCVDCDQWNYCHGGPMHKRQACGCTPCCWHLNYHE